MKVWNVGAVKQGGTRQADLPASTVRWGREASTDHSHEDGERAADAVLLTPQDPRTTRHRRVPAPHRPATAPGKLRNTRVVLNDLLLITRVVTMNKEHVL